MPQVRDTRQYAILILVACICAAASLWSGLQCPVNDDDIYHLHSVWLTAHGFVPYRDFFEIHLPGMWILMTPMTWMISSGASLFIVSRVLTALFFGATVFLAGATVHAKGPQAVLLGLASLFVMGRCEFFLFRVEYLVALLLFLHFWLLSRVPEDKPQRGGRDMLAAAVLAFACTMSVRPAVFLGVQPFLILAARRGPGIAVRIRGFLVGIVLGATPCLLFLAIHRLWADAWLWSVKFGSSSNVVRLQLGSVRHYGAIFLFGLACMAVVLTDRRIPFLTRAIPGASWPVGFLFYVFNPLKAPYSFVHFLLITAMLFSCVPQAVTRFFPLVRLPGSRVFWSRVVMGAALAAASGLVIWPNAIPPRFVVIWQNSIPPRFDRAFQHAQLRLLDWLQAVSKGEPVVLVAPYHPVVVPDATDLQQAGEYAYWLRDPRVKARVENAPRQMLDRKPPVISADAWLNHTSGRNLVDWLAANEVGRPVEIDALRHMIASEYVEVSFAALSARPYGSRFWVRKDRLVRSQPPQPSTVSTPFLDTGTLR